MSAPRKAAKSAARSSGRNAAAPKANGSKAAPNGRKPARPTQRKVYSFGDGRADGRADMRETLGGKGANLAEMTRLGLPVPPGFTDLDGGLRRVRSSRRQAAEGRPCRRADGARRASSRSWVRRFGDADGSAARVGALRCARLDARHDGHGAEPRPQRTRRCRGSPSPRTSASPTTATAASSRCTATWCSKSRTASFEQRLEEKKRETGCLRSDTDLDGAGRCASLTSTSCLELVEEHTGARPSRRTLPSSSGARSPPSSAELGERSRAITYRRLARHPRRPGAPP